MAEFTPVNAAREKFGCNESVSTKDNVISPLKEDSSFTSIVDEKDIHEKAALYYLEQRPVWCHLYKACNSHLSQAGNFGTREGKNNRQSRKPMKFRTNDSKRWNSNEIKFQQFMRRFPFETSNEARAAHQRTRTCLDWSLATRLENRKSDEWGEE
ncbi:hypothetical protein AVEN_87907-1 [Araneus ventricosus]|uniref:Uncharacterized protein n=1 Tax=Araneus ventricosus TaxID=182803 RepID=A0A4Y2BE64_ARAVE|nr:hypothetical protein AVEN_87907-1 [Araneus ventricosus]